MINKALILTQPNTLELQQCLIRKLGPREVLIQIDSTCICQTDFTTISGQFDTLYPAILGHEFSGTVISRGECVFNVAPGDRVTSMAYYYCGICSECNKGRQMSCNNFKAIPNEINGGYQQFTIVHDIMLFKISSKLSLEEASLTEPTACAYASVERANIYPGETVVIIGPGPIGLLTLQVAKMKFPGSIIMIGTRYERLELAKKYGANYAINFNEKDAFQTIMNVTNSKGADVVHFCGGGLDAWNLASKLLKPFGRVIVEAIPHPFSSKWPVAIGDFQKNISYLGVGGYSSQNFISALNCIECGLIDVKSLITHRFSFDDYMTAFQTAQLCKNEAIKVVIKPNN